MFISLIVEKKDEPPVFPPKVWQIVPLLSHAEAALYGGARSLVDWHDRHQHCARCGAQTHAVKAGWSRQCGTCSAEHFPRTDPVVIMLAEYEGKVLIARGIRFPPGRFSALAGFVEPGETIEEAVRREIWEECGVRTGRVDYLFSQPWPFPSQLMIACVAQALGDELTLDTQEIAEAMWVSREGPWRKRRMPPSSRRHRSPWRIICCAGGWGSDAARGPPAPGGAGGSRFGLLMQVDGALVAERLEAEIAVIAALAAAVDTAEGEAVLQIMREDAVDGGAAR